MRHRIAATTTPPVTGMKNVTVMQVVNDVEEEKLKSVEMQQAIE